MATATEDPQWKKTACILCSLNCGLDVQVGGPGGRHLVKIKGDRDHPISRGYFCEKAQRLDFYQTAGDRLDSPLRRRPDGGFEAIDWDTAIREVAAKFADVKARYGGDKILYYGGGGQGNHLGGSYGAATLAALGNRYRSNALAQEKTGEFWVNGRMIGAGTHGDFEHCEVAVFIGKNPWQSHGFARARASLREMARDPKRSIVVIDPRRSETAEKADFHLAIKPGTDAWCLAALVAILVQEDLVRHDWVAEHTTGFDEIAPRFRAIDVASYAAACGVEEDLLRRAARRIAGAASVSVYEDLGMQMSVHSTLGSWLQRLIWLFTGNFGRKGTNYAPLPLVALTGASKAERRGTADDRPKVSPVAGAKIITGLIPCNVMAEEILTDHPNRYRAMLIESGNPLHSVADSQRMREAMRQLELLVVIDVALTESAREAHYVLPASSQFEKPEATYFNLEFPRNAFHLRHPVMEPLPGTLAEPEIHARLVEAMGELGDADYAPLREAAAQGRFEFASAFLQAMATSPRVAKYAPVVLYRTLGPTLPDGMAAGAVYWAFAHQYVQKHPEAAARAGFEGDPFTAGEKLFDTILESRTAVVFSDEEYDASWSRIRMPEHRINLAIPELYPELEKLTGGPRPRDRAFPFILSAGERRSDTTNTIIRNPASLAKERAGTLRMSVDDAGRLGVADGEIVRLSTRRGSSEVPVEVTDMMQPGHISIPNGEGMDYMPRDGGGRRIGVAPNELTAAAERDFLAGTPWHKHVPARVERIA
ncbi:MAG TPA: molybdopterin-dependent oxidoreductase [Candidatus Eisenbacteria bacterium]|nr:molybdopterin-dependent oxidoreductase [Candidatus Eisenbacteria bacterium]